MNPFISDVLASEADASENQELAWEADLGPYKNVSVQIVAEDLDDNDGEVLLQDSNDNQNWNDIPDTSITLDTGDSSNIINLNNFVARYLRVVWDKGSNTLGTLTVTAVAKN